MNIKSVHACAARKAIVGKSMPLKVVRPQISFGSDSIELNNDPLSAIRNKYAADKVTAKTIEGRTPNKETYEALLGTFTELNKKGIVNFDLTPQNIALGEGGVKFKEFGNTVGINDWGNPFGGTYSNKYKPVMTKTGAQRVSNVFANQSKFYSGLQGQIYALADNPYLPMRANESVFEAKTLFPYLTSSKCENPSEMLSLYLKTKSEKTWKVLSEFIEEVKGNTESQVTKNKVQKAINYGNLAQKVLASPDEDILKVEALKMQFRNTLMEGESARTPEAKAAYTVLKDNLEEIINNPSISKEKKEYLGENLSFYEKLFSKYYTTQNAELVKDKKGILSQLFTESTKEEGKVVPMPAKEATKEEKGVAAVMKSFTKEGEEAAAEAKGAVKDSLDNAKESGALNSIKSAIKNKKIPVIVGVAALLGVGGYAANKIMKNKEENKVTAPKPEVDNTVDTASALLQKSLNNAPAFSAFA